MLKEIRSEEFREKIITFEAGLNVVLGDKQASNSIGKSTLLMVIDFVFAGDTFLKKDSGAIEALGHHTYFFKFQFEQNYYFSRSTTGVDELYVCDENYLQLHQIELDEYKLFLKEKYHLSHLSSSFREIVGLYSRIWNKENNDVSKPLQYFDKQKDKDSITNLIKLFEKYSGLKAIDVQLKEVTDSNRIFNSAQKKDFIPKVGKRDFVKNTKRIEELEAELKNIQDNILKYTLNFTDKIRQSLFSFRDEREELSNAKHSLLNKITRLDQQLKEKGLARSKYFQKLDEFFPSVNYNKIIEIEEFHSNLAKILNDELRTQKRNYLATLSQIDEDIKSVDQNISKLTDGDDISGKVVNHIYDITAELNEKKRTNNYYQEKEKLKGNITELKKILDALFNEVLKTIEDNINKELLRLNELIHSEFRTPPNIKLFRERYFYSINNNTGTGKAFINLILFDLAVLELTKLPFIIHDSYLFKNVENSSIENLVKIYFSLKKQVFISIDEIGKYKIEIQRLIQASTRIELDNTDLLYRKDWRK